MSSALKMDAATEAQSTFREMVTSWIPVPDILSLLDLIFSDTSDRANSDGHRNWTDNLGDRKDDDAESETDDTDSWTDDTGSGSEDFDSNDDEDDDNKKSAKTERVYDDKEACDKTREVEDGPNTRKDNKKLESDKIVENGDENLPDDTGSGSGDNDSETDDDDSGTEDGNSEADDDDDNKLSARAEKVNDVKDTCDKTKKVDDGPDTRKDDEHFEDDGIIENGDENLPGDTGSIAGDDDSETNDDDSRTEDDNSEADEGDDNEKACDKTKEVYDGPGAGKDGEEFENDEVFESGDENVRDDMGRETEDDDSEADDDDDHEKAWNETEKVDGRPGAIKDDEEFENDEGFEHDDENQPDHLADRNGNNIVAYNAHHYFNRMIKRFNITENSLADLIHTGEHAIHYKDVKDILELPEVQYVLADDELIVICLHIYDDKRGHPGPPQVHSLQFIRDLAQDGAQPMVFDVWDEPEDDHRSMLPIGGG